MLLFIFSLVTCLPLTAPDNGMIVCTGNLFEDTCTITCNPGYELTGSGITTCLSNQTWSGTDAICIEGIILNVQLDVCTEYY